MNKRISEMVNEEKLAIFNSFFRDELLYMDDNNEWKRCTEIKQNQRTIYKIDVVSKYDSFIDKKAGDVVVHNGMVYAVLKESEDIYCKSCSFNSEDLSLCPLVRDNKYDRISLACEQNNKSVVYCGIGKLDIKVNK